MTVEQLQDFIADNVHANVPADTVKEMMTDAASMDFGSFVDKWDETLKARSEGWSNLRNEAKPLPERLTAAFGTSDEKNPFKQDSNFRDELYEKSFKDVPKEQFDETVANMSKYWEDEKRAREYNASRKRREKEINDANIISPWSLASEYSKQRYIDDPNASIFGKEGEFNPYSKEGQDEIRDVAFGVAGATLDAVPGVGGVVGGPAVRLARDIYHSESDSPYKKDLETIGKDALTDVGFNVGTNYLPTVILRRGNRIGKNTSKLYNYPNDVAAVADVALRTKQNTEALNYLKNNIDSGIFDDIRVGRIRVETMPESDIKHDIMKIVNSDTYTKDDIQTYIDAYTKAADEGMLTDLYEYKPKTARIEPIAKAEQAETPVFAEGANSYFDAKERVGALSDWNKKQTSTLFNNSKHPIDIPTGKAYDAAVNVGAKVANKWGPVGESVVKVAETGAGRGSDVKKTDDAVKDWYKYNYERDWKIGFKPNEKEGDLLWEAYKEWTEGK